MKLPAPVTRGGGGGARRLANTPPRVKGTDVTSTTPVRTVRTGGGEPRHLAGAALHQGSQKVKIGSQASDGATHTTVSWAERPGAGITGKVADPHLNPLHRCPGTELGPLSWTWHL